MDLAPHRDPTTAGVVALSDLCARLSADQRLLGLDLGSKIIGLAVSNPTLTVASPIGVLRRTRFTRDAEALAVLARDRNIGGFVIGLPVNMDGSEGPAAQSARQFAHNLIARSALFETPPRIAFWDERLSTAAVTRAMLQANLTRRQRAKAVDQAAAAYILQGALESLGR